MSFAEKVMSNQIGDDSQTTASVIPEGDVAAWEEIEPGRFMPRRICGSMRGRKLG